MGIFRSRPQVSWVLQETDSEMEFHLHDIYKGVSLGSTSEERRGAKQKWAEEFQGEMQVQWHNPRGTLDIERPFRVIPRWLGFESPTLLFGCGPPWQPKQSLKGPPAEGCLQKHSQELRQQVLYWRSNWLCVTTPTPGHTVHSNPSHPSNLPSNLGHVGALKTTLWFNALVSMRSSKSISDFRSHNLIHIIYPVKFCVFPQLKAIKGKTER